MALNFLSKLGIIIGIVTCLGSFFITLDSISRIDYVFTHGDSDFSYPISYKVEFVGTLFLTVLICILSIILIVGIIKKRHMLLAPWLIVGFLLSIFLSIMVVYQTATRTYFRWDMLISMVAVIGSEIILLYPISQLFIEIRGDNAAVGNPKPTESNYVHNIQTTCDVVSQKTVV